MHDELHPLRGSEALHVVDEAIECRFRHASHDHAVKVYPTTWVYQVRWQHKVPDKAGLQAMGLDPAALIFEAETCWYTLHDMGGPVFQKPWNAREGLQWRPMQPLRRTVRLPRPA